MGLGLALECLHMCATNEVSNGAGGGGAAPWVALCAVGVEGPVLWGGAVGTAVLCVVRTLEGGQWRGGQG